jgi:hypothetical protein
VFNYLALGAIVLGASNTLESSKQNVNTSQSNSLTPTQGLLGRDIEIEVCNSEGEIVRRFPRQKSAKTVGGAKGSSPAKTGRDRRIGIQGGQCREFRRSSAMRTRWSITTT